jgi:predicted transcriptional regulator
VQGLQEMILNQRKAAAASMIAAEHAGRDRTVIFEGLCRLQQEAMAHMQAEAKADRELMREVLLGLASPEARHAMKS